MISNGVGVRRVLLVIHSLGCGGAERSMSQLAAELVKNELVEVHLAIWGGSTGSDFYIPDEKIHLHTLRCTRNGNTMLGRIIQGVYVLLRLRATMIKTKPDCVLSFIDQTNVMCLIASLFLRIRIVVSERIDPRHNNMLGVFWKMARVLCYRKASLVVAQTQSVAKWIGSSWSVPTDVVPNFLRELPALEDNREQIIISIGRLADQKGFDLSIRAFANLSDKYPDWKYIILGDGYRRAELLKLCNSLGVSDRVYFIGQVDNVEQWLARASISVQPSRFEGFPNAVMEAMGMGLATISADCPSGPSDLIKHGHNGILVPVDDVGRLTLELDRLMSNASLRAELGACAMAIRQTLSPYTIVSKWEAILFGDNSIKSNNECKNVVVSE